MSRFRIGAFALLSTALPVSALAAGDAQTLSELKRLNVEDLMNVEVTSVTKHPVRLLDVASAIQVITQSEIRRSGATSLPEALRLADNLQVAQRGSHTWAVSARGFNTDLANKLLVMIDGRSVYTPLFSGVFWEAQDTLLEDVDRIEVISGPGGTLWGANAVNGVINVITRSAADTQGFFAEAGAGSAIQGTAGVRYGGSLSPHTDFRVYAKHVDGDDGVLTGGAHAPDGWRRMQAGFRVDSTPTTSDALTLQGDIYELDEDDPQGGNSALRGANVLGRWSRTLSVESDFSLQAYFDRTTMTDPVPPLLVGVVPVTPAGVFHDELRTADVDFQHRFRIGGVHRITWGLGFRDTHDDVDSAPGLTFLPEVLDQQLYSAFFQDEIALGETVALTLGSKLEHNGYTGFEVEPNARLLWRPSSSQTFWSAVSRAVRTPSRIDHDLRQAAPPYFQLLQGRSTFVSENVVAYELGHRAQVSSRFTTGLSLFYNDYSDVRSTAITPTTLLPFYFANDLEGHSHGAELTANVQLTDDWSVHAGYNFLRTSLRVKPGAFDLSNARNETSDPEHQASLRSSLRLGRRVDVDAGLRWVDTLHNNNGPNLGVVPAYLELDARVAWHVSSNLELSVVGRNLLDHQHPEYGFPSPARAEVERSVFGKLAWRH